VEKSLQSEKNNITEPGEGELVHDIDSRMTQYRSTIKKFIGEPRNPDGFLNLQKGYAALYQDIMKLSEMNGKAIELKTDDAKLSSKRALTQMSILATLCFLIALSFTFSFASYFNERFFQLYNGIREIASDNYGQRLHFEGNDEFHEISLVFNEMAEKLSSDKAKMDVTLVLNPEKLKDSNDLIELKKLLTRLKNVEKQSIEVLARLENKK
jgi:nitrogen fixation/metabolism regulation signal transduction histidine kinase